MSKTQKKQANGEGVGEEAAKKKVKTAEGKRAPMYKAPKLKHPPNTVFVVGFAPTVTEAELKKIFSSVGTVTHTKLRLDRSNKPIGSGFVSFENPTASAELLAKGKFLVSGSEAQVLQTVVDKRKEAKKQAQKRKAGKETEERANTLYVEGVPLDATEAEIRDYFNRLHKALRKGSDVVTKVNIPLADGTPRGFCFVGFSTEEACDAVLNREGEFFIRPKHAVTVTKANPPKHRAPKRIHKDTPAAPAAPSPQQGNKKRAAPSTPAAPKTQEKGQGSEKGSKKEKVGGVPKTPVTGVPKTPVTGVPKTPVTGVPKTPVTDRKKKKDA